MYSVKFDNTELVNATYYLQYARHQSAPERNLTLLSLSNEDGSVLVAEKYGSKVITVKGHISVNTVAELQTQVDTMKQLFAGKEKNLDILPDGGMTRRYVATCMSHTLTQDFYNITFLPYEAQFIVTSGVGKDTSATAALDAVAVTVVEYSSSFTLAGSALRQKPIITMTLSDTFTKADGIEFKLTNGSEDKIIITRDASWTATDVLIIDTNLEKVTYEGTEIPFYRTMPSFALGVNNFTITVGDIVDEQFLITGDVNGLNIYDTRWDAQSFSVSHTDTTYRSIALYLLKVGTPGNDLVVEIQTDDNGKPSGNEVSGATFLIPKAEVSAVNFGYNQDESAAKFTLSANTTYWIVAKTTGGDASNYYNWGYLANSLATYRKGYAKQSTDSGVNWVDYITYDLGFKVQFGNNTDGDNNDNYTLDVDYTKRYL